MSTRKRPLSEISQPAQRQNQTPSRARYAPSTPHAIRALQQRSGAQRSVRTRKLAIDTLRPDSARGILRRLAKITAPATKTARTPSIAAGKENVVPQQEEDDEQGNVVKRPRMTFDLEESIEEPIPDLPDVEEEEDSELLAAPTPSVLQNDDDHPTVTFKSIDFAHNGRSASEGFDRRKSRVSFAGLDDQDGEDSDEDGDATMLTERGRRANSEDLTRLSRYSFGSIRMSGFGSGLEVRTDPDQTKRTGAEFGNEYEGLGIDDEVPLVLDGETENLRSLRRSTSVSATSETNVHIPQLDESFRLEFPDEFQDEVQSSNHVRHSDSTQKVIDGKDVGHEARDELGDEEQDVLADAIPGGRRLTDLEIAAATKPRKSRQKRLKMTRHGTMVPSLPSSLIKRIAIETQTNEGLRKPKLGRDHMKALEQATEWFFEQVGEDLEAFSSHARRKKRIDSSDVLLLMSRQRVLQGEGKLQQMAKDWLPKDILDELDLPDSL